MKSGTRARIASRWAPARWSRTAGRRSPMATISMLRRHIEPGSRMVPMMFDHTASNRSREPGAVSASSRSLPSKASETSPISATYACASSVSLEP